MASVAPVVTITSSSGEKVSPYHDFWWAAMAARSSGTPWLGGYWLRPATMASAATCASSGGPSVSGKPWPRLRDPVARARSDMAAKIVVVKGRSRSTSSFCPWCVTRTMVPVPYGLAGSC